MTSPLRTLTLPFSAVGEGGGGFSKPDISNPFGMRRDIVPKVVDCLLAAYNQHLGDKAVSFDSELNRLLKKTPFRNTAAAQVAWELQSTPDLRPSSRHRRATVPAE